MFRILVVYNSHHVFCVTVVSLPFVILAYNIGFQFCFWLVFVSFSSTVLPTLDRFPFIHNDGIGSKLARRVIDNVILIKTCC